MYGRLSYFRYAPISDSFPEMQDGKQNVAICFITIQWKMSYKTVFHVGQIIFTEEMTEKLNFACFYPEISNNLDDLSKIC